MLREVEVLKFCLIFNFDADVLVHNRIIFFSMHILFFLNSSDKFPLIVET